MEVSLLIFDGALDEDVRDLMAMGGALVKSGVASFTLVGDAEVVADVTLDSGAALTPATRLRNRPPQDLVLVPGYTEDAEVRSLLQAREPMDEHLLAMGTGVLLLAQAGLLDGHTVSAPAATREQLAALGVTVTDAPFTAGRDLTTAADPAGARAALVHWADQRTGGTAGEKLRSALAG